MSLQTLKKKSDTTAHNYIHTSTFAINGGPRNLSYTGKSMKNSTVRTPFRGTLPVGYAGGGTSVVLAYPPLKAEIGATYTPQRSVRNTKSMIATKYTWITGQYPNAWTQPNTNLTSAEHTQNLKSTSVFLEQNTRDSLGVLMPIFTPITCCKPITNRPTSVHSILQRIIEHNAQGTNVPPPAAVSGFSDYMSRLRATALAQTGEDKPFPFYTNSHCGNTIAYTTSPDWYKTTGLLTNIATNRCTMAEANAVFDDAKAVATAAVAAWSDIQNGAPGDVDTAEVAAIAAQQASVDAAQDVLILVTKYCEPEQVIQNAQAAFVTESTLLNELNAQ
jgi:hypothetical protein